MRTWVMWLMVLSVGGALVTAQDGTGTQASAGIYAKWKAPVLNDPAFFPISVWAQHPKVAAQYKAAGVNTYTGLHGGPTEEELAALKKAGMYVVCAQNEVGLKHKDDPTILGWLHDDEPDLAKGFQKWWKGDLARIKEAWPEYGTRTEKEWGENGPPAPPRWIQQAYAKARAADPTRPVLVNFGPPVADVAKAKDRGIRTPHPDDYAEYLKGCDMASFDIYPLNDSRPWVHKKLELVGQGVGNLRKWTEGRKPVWFCVEATSINGAPAPTAEQVRSEVWLGLINGGSGIIYFVHQFKPKYSSHYLLDDAALLAGVTELNRQVLELAPVLNSPTVPEGAEVASSADVPVAAMVKRHGGAAYVFAACTRNAPTRATFKVQGLPARAVAEVLGEKRTVAATEGTFADEFKGYGVRLYRIK